MKTAKRPPSKKSQRSQKAEYNDTKSVAASKPITALVKMASIVMPIVLVLSAVLLSHGGLELLPVAFLIWGLIAGYALLLVVYAFSKESSPRYKVIASVVPLLVVAWIGWQAVSFSRLDSEGNSKPPKPVLVDSAPIEVSRWVSAADAEKLLGDCSVRRYATITEGLPSGVSTPAGDATGIIEVTSTTTHVNGSPSTVTHDLYMTDPAQTSIVNDAEHKAVASCSSSSRPYTYHNKSN